MMMSSAPASMRVEGSHSETRARARRSTARGRAGRPRRAGATPGPSILHRRRGACRPSCRVAHWSASSAPATMPTTLNSASAGSDAWTCSASTPGSIARSALTGRRRARVAYLPCVRFPTVAQAGAVGFAPATGRSTNESCELSAANAQAAASFVSTLSVMLPSPLSPVVDGTASTLTFGRKRQTLSAAAVHVDEVARLNLREAPVDVVDRDRDPALRPDDLRVDRESEVAAKSASVSCCPGRMSATAARPARNCGSVTAPTSTSLRGSVVAWYIDWDADEHSGCPLLDDPLGDQDGGGSIGAADTCAVAVEVDDQQDGGKHDCPDAERDSPAAGRHSTRNSFGNRRIGHGVRPLSSLSSYVGTIGGLHE